MSERWKFQTKVGLFWGLFMTFFNLFFEEKPIQAQVASADFYLRAAVFILAGIFILGYINWKARVKTSTEK